MNGILSWLMLKKNLKLQRGIELEILNDETINAGKQKRIEKK